MYQKIWYENIQDFITSKNYFIIIPLSQMSLEDKLNAILRFFLYFGIVLALFKNNYKYLLFPIIVGLLTIIIYKYEQNKKKIIETELERNSLDIVENKVCTRVTVDNPFMNPSLADLTFNPDKPGACDVTNDKIKENIDNKFNRRIFKDVNDLFNNQSSQRQFYTVASTTIPNDQGGFADWLYNRGPSCKDGNGDQCWRNVSDINLQTGGNGGGSTRGAA
jgi:hypothetical protein